MKQIRTTQTFLLYTWMFPYHSEISPFYWKIHPPFPLPFTTERNGAAVIRGEFFPYSGEIFISLLGIYNPSLVCSWASFHPGEISGAFIEHFLVLLLFEMRGRHAGGGRTETMNVVFIHCKSFHGMGGKNSWMWA